MDMRRSKPLFVLLAIVAALTYAVVVEVGVHAGRVHHGVSVEGLDLGGLTLPEARRAVAARGSEMAAEELTFTSDRGECSFLPRDVGWNPRPRAVALRALAVGRSGGLFTAAGDRIEAWFGGVEIEWSDYFDPQRLDAEREACEQDTGAAIDDVGLEAAVRSAVGSWPRRPMELPLEG